MSEDPNLDLLREIYAAWARGDYSRNDMFADDVEFVTGAPEARIYHGREGARRAWFDFLSAWEDFRTEAEEIVRVADDHYVVFTHLIGRGKESHVPTEGATANVVLFRDGQIVRLELHWDRDEARRSAQELATRRATRR